MNIINEIVFGWWINIWFKPKRKYPALSPEQVIVTDMWNDWPTWLLKPFVALGRWLVLRGGRALLPKQQGHILAFPTWSITDPRPDSSHSAVPSQDFYLEWVTQSMAGQIRISVTCIISLPQSPCFSCLVVLTPLGFIQDSYLMYFSWAASRGGVLKLFRCGAPCFLQIGPEILNFVFLTEHEWLPLVL